MVVRNLTTIVPKIWVPPQEGPNWKITVTRSNGTVDDVTDYITQLEVIDLVTTGIGSFSVTLINADDRYTDVWTGNEVFTYYCDYGSATPTTKMFTGRVEKISHTNYMITLRGRAEALFVHSKNVVKTYEDQDYGYIIKDLFDTYGESRYDTSEINTSTGVLLTIDFTDIPFWTAIESASQAAGYDCYVDPDKIVQAFEAESRINTTDGIVHDNNLVGVSDFGYDNSLVYNQIRVIGATIEGTQLMYTANDSTSQTDLGIKRKNIYDEGLTTFEAVTEVGDYYLAQAKDSVQVGEVKGFLLATPKPGEMIWCSSPLDDLPPTRYRVVQIKHEFKDEGQFTTLVLNKEKKKLSTVMKERIQRENKTVGASNNPEDLDFGYVDLFDSDTGTHSSTEISGGLLYLAEGSSQGTWISATISSADSNKVEKARLSLVGDNFRGVYAEISADNGVTYQEIERNTLTTIVNKGTQIKLKLRLTGAITKLDAIQLQYSTE